MNFNEIYQPSRFWLLTKLELFRSRKGVLITIVVTFGLLCTGFILENIFNSSRIPATVVRMQNRLRNLISFFSFHG